MINEILSVLISFTIQRYANPGLIIFAQVLLYYQLNTPYNNSSEKTVYKHADQFEYNEKCSQNKHQSKDTLMMKNAKANILVIEDDKAILKGLVDVLLFNGYQAQGEIDGIKGLDLALSNRFDLILLDVMLPGMDGFTICKKIRKEKPNQAVIIITARGAEDDIISGFKFGADDYIPKPFSIRELMVRVEAVLRRAGKILGDDILRWNGLEFNGNTLNVAFGEKSAELTRKEMDIVVYLVRYSDRIVSKQELLSEVWNYAVTDIETRTVDIHMLKLRKKISSLIGKRPFLLTVRGEGYRLEPEQ